MKSTMAKTLIQQFTKPDDIILDPFVGSGTVALESIIAKRKVSCFDANPYGMVLTKAKLFPPKKEEIAFKIADKYLRMVEERECEILLNDIPDWVKKFFHPKTLTETNLFAQLLLDNKQYFLLACLLGILHHQRPGFLSYPASHSIPYLRNRKFPQSDYPELYSYREIRPRIFSKIRRVYKRFPSIDNNLIKKCERSNVLDIVLEENSIDSIITSPPYMDNLDYYRDNRLRLWFMRVNYENKEIVPNMKNIVEFKYLMKESLSIFEDVLKPDGYCVLVMGDVVKNSVIHTGRIVIDILKNFSSFEFIMCIKDRRYINSFGRRREKEEWVIVIRKRV